MVRAAQKGEAKASSPEVARAASSIKMKDAKKFASTKHKGLPEKKMKKESVSEDAKMARQSDDKLSAAHKKFSSMEQTPANSFMKKRIAKEIARRKKGIGAKKVEEAMSSYDRNRKAAAKRAAARNAERKAGKRGGRMERETYRSEGGVEMHHKGYRAEDIKMTRKAYKKLHKDFKSDDPKNPRTTKYEPGKGTVSHRVKFTDEYVPEGANPYGKRAKIKMIIKGFSEKNRSKAGSVKEDAIDENIVKDVISNVKKVGGKVKDKIKDVMNRPIMAPTINKQQHLQKIRNSGGNPSHWESAQNEGALATGAALTAAGLAAWKFSKGMQTRNKMKKAIDTPGTNLNSIKNATDQKNKMLQQLNQSYVPPGMEISEKKKGMIKIKVNKPIKAKVTDIGAGGKEYVRKNWEQTTVTNDGSKLSPLHVPGGPNSQFNSDGTKKVLKKTLNKIRGTAFKTEGLLTRKKKPAKKTTGRDAGAIAAKIMRDKEQKKYVGFLPANEEKKFGPGGDPIKKPGFVDKALTKLKNQIPVKKIDTDSGIKEESCGKGMYYCKDMKKCKPIPEGHTVESDGTLVKEAAKLKKANINYKTTKKDGKTTYHVNKNDEADAQKAMKNDPKYILGKTRVKPVKEATKRDEYGDPIGGPKISKKQLKKNLASNEKDDKITHSEAAAWTKKSGKSPSGGLNEKGRKSYEKANPGSDLKAPSKKVGNKRRASFCARMSGMKKKLTSKKTASDPDSRINKSLRKWNCSYEFDGNEILISEKDTALELVKKSIHDKYGKGAIMRKGSNQKKKVRGAKSTSGTGKYLKKHQEKQQLKKDAKEMGYGKDTKSYVNVRARYGSKENMKSGKGLGT